MPSFISSDLNGVENISKIHNKSAEGGCERAIGRIVRKFNVRNYVSKLEYPCESMSDPSGTASVELSFSSQMEMIKT